VGLKWFRSLSGLPHHYSLSFAHSASSGSEASADHSAPGSERSAADISAHSNSSSRQKASVKIQGSGDDLCDGSAASTLEARSNRTSADISQHMMMAAQDHRIVPYKQDQTSPKSGDKICVADCSASTERRLAGIQEALQLRQMLNDVMQGTEGFRVWVPNSDQQQAPSAAECSAAVVPLEPHSEAATFPGDTHQAAGDGVPALNAHLRIGVKHEHGVQADDGVSRHPARVPGQHPHVQHRAAGHQAFARSSLDVENVLRGHVRPLAAGVGGLDEILELRQLLSTVHDHGSNSNSHDMEGNAGAGGATRNDRPAPIRNNAQNFVCQYSVV
jgi:hypothetical protein